MENDLIRRESKVKALQQRVDELERQLAEAQDVVLTLTSRKTRKQSLDDPLGCGRTLHKMRQEREEEKATFVFSEERLRNVLLLVPYPLMIRRDDGKVVMINAAWTGVTGYTLEDIPTIEEWTRKAHGRLGPQCQALILKEGFSQEGIKKWGELEVTTRSGGKRIWDFSTAPLGVDENGHELVMTMAVDITERKQAEERIAYQARLLASVNDAIVGSDAEFRLTVWNAVAESLYGWKAEEVLGRNGLEVLQTQWLQENADEMRRRIAETGRWRGEASQLRKDGTRIPVEISSIVLRNEREQITGYVSVNRDITERKRMEEALRESEERFAKAFHASPSALVISRQADGRIETVNDTFVKFFGYSLEEVLGKTSTELHLFANPDDRQKAVRRLQRNGFLRDFELDVRLRSGEVRNVSLSVEAMNVGGETMMLTMLLDITLRKRAEDALRASEERYRAVVKNALDAIVVTDPSRGGKVMAVNPAACSMFGYSPEEFLGLDRKTMLDTSDPRLAAFLKQRRRRGQITAQLTYKRKDGTRFSGELSSVFYRDKNGEQLAVTIIRDITEREQFEVAMRKRESILAQAGKIAHLGAWDIEFHNQGNVNANPLAWSDEVYRIFGYAPGEVEPSNELFFERVHPDDRRLVQESVAQAIARRQPYVIEHRICRPDGAERIVQEHAEVFFDEAGAPLRIVGAVQDITERKRAEEALRESEERFRSLADSMPQLVWMAQPDGTVDYYNSRYQEYQEIKQVKAQAWDWAPVLHPDDLQPTISAWQHSVRTGEIYQIEHRVRMTDGSYRWHLSRGVPILDEEGQVVRWFGTATDIHDVKLAEEQLKVYAQRLEHSNHELEQFAFMASHDLQEPLRKIEVFGDLLLERSTSLNGRERNYLERMRSAAGRMRDMVEGLLQLSRVTTQGKPFVQVELSQVTAEVLYDLDHQLRRVGGKVDYEALPAVEGDPLQLRQLLQNLIGNALKYHQPDVPPEVKVYVKQLPGKAQIFVEDNGIGFEQEDAERIFKPFQRLVGRSQYEGSGIGLAICRRIVERHHGEIAARSQPGGGATFIVTLPIYHPLANARHEARKDVNDEDPGTPPGR